MTNYTATTWVDDIPAGTGTPLNAANMNKLEGGASAALPRDSVFIAGALPYQNKLATIDAQPAFRFYGDGKHEWGPGGTGAADTNLYRSSGGILKTDTNFRADGYVSVGNHVYLSTDASRLYFGNTSDTSLYRNAANRLRTDGDLSVAGHVYVATNDTSKLFFGGAADTDLYRSSAGVLKTDGSLVVTNELTLGSYAVPTKISPIGLTAAGGGYAGTLGINGALSLYGPQCVLRVGTQDNGDFGSGGNDRGIYLMDSGRVPGGPTTGGYLYSVNGSLYWKGLTNTQKLIMAG